MLLANIAMPLYCLRELFRINNKGRLSDLLPIHREGFDSMATILALEAEILILA
ncbi:MAG TPA: hypothetical protein VKC60_02565 [Opitutaceae bacterium]|nr:hypothetical protein [Opitutaceae bacterium]